jgi:hypothetical protein
LVKRHGYVKDGMKPVGAIKKCCMAVLAQVAITSEGQKSPDLIERKMIRVSELMALYNAIVTGTVRTNPLMFIFNGIFHTMRMLDDFGECGSLG